MFDHANLEWASFPFLSEGAQSINSVTIPDVAGAVAGGLGVWSSTMEKGIDMATTTGGMVSESNVDGTLNIMEKPMFEEGWAIYWKKQFKVLEFWHAHTMLLGPYR